MRSGGGSGYASQVVPLAARQVRQLRMSTLRVSEASEGRAGGILSTCTKKGRAVALPFVCLIT